MGFYGNITSASKTQFSFDRIYPNRQKMEENMVEDGIYMGRFVLIDYDQDVTKDQYRLFYYENGKFYMFAEAAAKIEVRYPGDVAMNEIIRVTSDINKDNTVKDDAKYTFWKCTGGDAEGIAQFKKVADAETNYTTNYQIDIAEYGEGRGWDSTVWQKVYTQGVAKYVMIAELNAVIPTFDIVPDAPSLAPIAPHFDQRSNNVYYKLHYQPQWGMRVKSADGIESDGKKVFSDEEIIWKKEIYNTATDEETIQYFDGKDWIKVEEDNKPTHAGAIYYNKAGFDPEIIAYDEETIDKVAIEATGISGELYNSHNGANPTETKPAEDIQEISIMLPSIGNSISKIWDIVYGNKEQNSDRFYEDEDGVIDTSKPLRNLDINWDSTEGLRLIKEKEDGNGFTFDTDDVSTLAGAINSVHDLMGMIIIDVKKEQQILDGDLDKIYYLDGKYYRKKQDYKYDDISYDNTNYFTPNLIGLTKENYIKNHYYYEENGKFIPDLNNEFVENRKYYELLLKDNIKNTPADNVPKYEADKYYYKNGLAESYTRDQNSTYNKNKLYYDITFNEVTLDAAYSPNNYYYIINNNYICDTSETPTLNRTYYLTKFNIVKDENGKPKVPYKAGEYFYEIKDKNNNTLIVRANEEKMKNDVEYFSAKIESSNNVIIETPDGYQTVQSTIITNRMPVNLFEITDENISYYYKENNNFIKTSAIVKNVKEYYVLDSRTEVSDFYVKNKFFITNNDKTTYYIDSRETKESDHYYIISNYIDPENKILKEIRAFYEPNKYVDKNGNIINEENPPEEFYYNLDFYISDKSFDNTNKYALWNNNVITVPASITLSIRTSDNIFKKEELIGFSRTLNTIHGLILKINELLEHGDEETRNQETVQGTINKLNDIIYKLNSLSPEQFLIVDNYGRMHSADFNTLQSNTATIFKDKNALLKGINGDRFEQVNSVEEMREQWLTVNVNGDIEKPLITIRHNYQPVKSIETKDDKNTYESNNVNKDKIDLYSPIIDRMGHIVGEKIETVTLPYSYKTFKTKGINSVEDKDIYTGFKEGNDTTPETSLATGPIEPLKSVASETQDCMTIDPVNKWIQTSIEDDKILIAHEIHAVDTISQNTNLNTDGIISNSNNDKIVIQDLEFDKAGHVIKNQKHTYTLPYGFKTITTNGRGTEAPENATGTPTTTNVVAENTQDTLAINSGNRWIRIDTNANADSLTISHDVHKTSSTSNTTDWTTTEANTTISVPTYNYDEAGHYQSHHTESYKLPFGYGKIIGDSGNTAATATYDELTFGSDNWLTATVEEDKVIYSHDYPVEAADTTSTSNVNGNGDTIVLETLTHDEKGHIIKVNQNTVTLPYGYKTFKDSNPTVGSSIASNTQDTFVFKGDSWINPTVSNDLLALTHTGPVGTAPAAKDPVEPKFGSTFDIEDWYFDDKGHKYAGSSHTVKIPQPSLATLGNPDNGASWVLTKLELNASEGKLTQTVNKIGSLTLSGYQKPEGGGFGPDSTLNTALNALQVQTISLQDQINQEKTNRENAITNVTGNSTETIASLLNKIDTLQNSYNSLADSYNDLLTRIKTLESYHAEENA